MQDNETHEEIWELIEFKKPPTVIIVVQEVEREQMVKESVKKRRNYTKIEIIWCSTVLVIGGVLIACAAAFCFF